MREPFQWSQKNKLSHCEIAQTVIGFCTVWRCRSHGLTQEDDETPRALQVPLCKVNSELLLQENIKLLAKSTCFIECSTFYYRGLRLKQDWSKTTKRPPKSIAEMISSKRVCCLA